MQGTDSVFVSHLATTINILTVFKQLFTMSCNKTLFESNTRAAACSDKLVYYSVPAPWKELGNEKLVC